MHKLRLYLDTSVIGAIYDSEDNHRVTVTNEVLAQIRKQHEFQGFVSNILIEEVERAPEDIRAGLKDLVKTGNFEILYENDECAVLAGEYIRRGILSKRYRDDARHIAVAVVHDIDTIVTWNCRHMANLSKKRLVNGVNLIMGYRQIDIVTPLEVAGFD